MHSAARTLASQAGGGAALAGRVGGAALAEDGPADEPAAELLGATARCFFAPCELDDAATTAGDRLDALRGWPRVPPPRCGLRCGPEGEAVRCVAVGAAPDVDAAAWLP